MKSRILFCLLALAFIAFYSAGIALAAEEGGGGEEGEAPTRSYTFLDMVEAGGLVGHIIILCSVISLAMIIENFVHLRRDKLMPPEILSEIEVLFEDEEYDEALELCEAEPSFLTNVIGAALPKRDQGYQEMSDTLTAQTDSEAGKQYMKLAYLSLVTQIAPMLGLLGTVQGMIVAFQKIATSRGAPEPAELADSISMALVTTFEGLSVAIPGTMFFIFFRNRVAKLAGDVLGVTQDLFERFKAAP